MNFCSAFTRSQVFPASSDRKIPPPESGASTLAHRRDGLAGDTAMPMRPSGRRGRPSLPEMSVQVSPPSPVFQSPLLPPPAAKPHGKRSEERRVGKECRGGGGGED